MPTRGEMNSLAQELTSSYEARVAAVASLREVVAVQRQAAGYFVRDMTTSRRAAAVQQRGDRAKGRSALAKETAAQLREITTARQDVARQQRSALTRSRAGLASGVAGQLRQFRAGRATLSRELRAALKKGRTELAQAKAQQRSHARGWLAGIAAERAGATEEWQHLTATLRSKRSGGTAVAEAPRRSAVEERAYLAHVEAAPVEGDEELVAQAEVGNVTPEFVNLSESVFEHLANHPDGSRLTELEQEFGMSRFEAARVIRRLIDEGKAEKRNLLYFAI